MLPSITPYAASKAAKNDRIAASPLTILWKTSGKTVLHGGITNGCGINFTRQNKGKNPKFQANYHRLLQHYHKFVKIRSTNRHRDWRHICHKINFQPTIETASPGKT